MPPSNLEERSHQLWPTSEYLRRRWLELTKELYETGKHRLARHIEKQQPEVQLGRA